jgi:hypothetical protein
VNLAAVHTGSARAGVRPQAGPAAVPRGARSWFVAALALVLAGNVMYSRHLFGDSYYDLYAGRYIIQHGIPRRNTVTAVSHGAPWIDQQWLAHVLYYAAWAVGGYRALAALSVTLVTAGFAVLARLMLRRGVPPAGVFGWTLAAFAVCAGNTWIRAQSFAYLFVALLLWLIVEDDRAPRLRARTWLVVPVLVLWANTHGSVLLGTGLVILYAGYRVVQALARGTPRPIPGYLALGAVAAAAVVCTPYGTGVMRYYASLIGNPVLRRYVPEWAPPSPQNPLSWAFFGLVLGTAIAVAVAWRRGARPVPLLSGLAVALLALALTGLRFQAWFGFGGSLLAADTLARSSGDGVPVLSAAFRRAVAGVLAAAALAASVALAVTPDRQFESLIPRRAIDAAAAIAARNPAMRVLADDWSCSPMLWLHPAMFGRVAFDARFEQYSGQQISAYLEFLFVQGRGWQHVMNRYAIVVASRRWNPRLASALGRLPGWQVVYRDRGGLVMERGAEA